MTDQERRRRNSAKLKELHPFFADKVSAIIKDLEGHGWDPYIVCAWRSPQEQLAAYKRGNSKVKYGFHNVSGKAGEKESLAVDIVSATTLYNAPVKFWLMLASSAQAHSCVSGALWTGANILLKRKIQNAINKKQFNTYKGKVGWDPAHVQALPDSALGKVKAGWRP